MELVTVNKKGKKTLKWWVWLVIFVLVAGISGLLNQGKAKPDADPSGGTENNQSQASDGADDQQEPEPSAPSSSTSIIEMPSISGSNAYDITVSLAERGFGDAVRSSFAGGYSWTATGIDGAYEIVGTLDDYAVCTIQASSTSADVLAFIASFPYGTADAESAMAWVRANFGSAATTTIGSAHFELYVPNGGTQMLYVYADGADDYFNSLA